MELPSNAYTDAAARAALSAPRQSPALPMLAGRVTSWAVLYGPQTTEQEELADGPTYAQSRLGLMEWIRKRRDWTPVTRTCDVNGAIARAVGRARLCKTGYQRG